MVSLNGRREIGKEEGKSKRMKRISGDFIP